MSQPSRMSLDPEMRAFYDGSSEETRLENGIARLVEIARQRSAELIRPIASCEIGDARSLAFPADCCDVVLLLGPLYHLTDAKDRASALSEAVRVLKPGGVVVAAAMTRWASALYGLGHDLFAVPAFRTLVLQTLRDGQNRNPDRLRGAFTTAYFHRPEELREEVEGAGLETEYLVGLEGPGCMLPDFAARWAQERQREDILRIAELVESEPSLLGSSAHILAVGRKRVTDADPGQQAIAE